MSIPVVAISILTVYLLNKFQGRFGVPNAHPAAAVYALPTPSQSSKPLHWGTIAITTVRYFLLGVVTPLMLIQLWIPASNEGLLKCIRGAITRARSAFATSSVLIYMGGFLVFGALPYFLLFHKTSSPRAWLELGFFGTKLIAVFGLTLFGWLITIRALSMVTVANADASKGA